MNPGLAAIAVLVVGGAVLAVVARDVRATILGLLVVLLGAPLVADPWPGLAAIVARVARDADVRLFEVAPTDDSLESVFEYLVSRR